jgi:hypothetical protein
MICETEIFEPQHYEAVGRPLLEAETLPLWCYTWPAFYRREVERIWRKVSPSQFDRCSDGCVLGESSGYHSEERRRSRSY